MHFVSLICLLCGRLVSEINGSRAHSSGNTLMHNQTTFHALFATFNACKQIRGLPHSCRYWNVWQDGKRIIMFSYGSGLASSLFACKFQEGQSSFSLVDIQKKMDIASKLESRVMVCPYFYHFRITSDIVQSWIIMADYLSFISLVRLCWTRCIKVDGA